MKKKKNNMEKFMQKMVKNIFIGSGVAIAGIVAATAVSYRVTNKLVRLALDREEPKTADKSKKRVRGIQELVELPEQIKVSAENLKNSDCETVEIVAHDGEKLVGHLHRCENAKRMIIAMHGWRSSWTKDFGEISDFWHKNDCSVLYAEQRGQNNSGGDYMGFGMLERYDCFDWINWVNENVAGKLPIYLAGLSMGASTVLMAAGLDLPENVCGMMVDCGFTSAHAIWKHIVENNLHLSYGIMENIANEMCKKKINMGAKDYSTIEAMQNNNIPVLFIHGTDDTFVPIEMTYQNYKACNAPKRLFVVPGATHAMSYIVDKEGYEKTVKEFWNDWDLSK